MQADSHPEYLVACPTCHAQFDPTGVRGDSFLCACGTRVANTRPQAVDAPVRRCSACGANVDGASETCRYCGSSLGAGAGRLICPECFARNGGQARFCTHCGVEFHPQPVLADGAPVPCPVCRTDLTPRTLAGLGVQECGSCRGLWVPKTNFDALVQHATEHARPHPTDGVHATPLARPAPQAAVAYRACPICRQTMYRKNFSRISGVIVDWCGAHGTWLDANELEAIAAFVAQGGMQRLADQEKEDARIAASMRVYDRIGQATPTVTCDGTSDVLVDVLVKLFD
jgi:Zn-finger nucleic acid-binding protein/ribosomal protein L40E